MSGSLTAGVGGLDHDVLDVVLGVLAEDVDKALSTLQTAGGQSSVTVLLSVADEVVLRNAILSSLLEGSGGSEASEGKDVEELHDWTLNWVYRLASLKDKIWGKLHVYIFSQSFGGVYLQMNNRPPPSGSVSGSSVSELTRATTSH